MAKRQYGVVSYQQARRAGFNRSAISWRLRSGEWTRMCPGVVRMFWADDSWAVRCRAVSLWAGRHFIGLSHLTAAQWLGFDVAPDEDVHFTTRTDARRCAPSWCRLHSTRGSGSSVDVDGLRVTSAEHTMVDLAGVLHEAELDRVLRVALRFGQVKSSALRTELSRRGRGHTGVVLMRKLFRLVRD